MVNQTPANVPLVGAFLRIVETAFKFVLDGPATDPNSMKRSGVHHTLAVIKILLATSQSILARSGTQLDDFMAETEGFREGNLRAGQ